MDDTAGYVRVSTREQSLDRQLNRGYKSSPSGGIDAKVNTTLNTG